MCLVQEEHWWSPSAGLCCCQRNLHIVSSPDCGHCAHLMCTVTAELLERAFLILIRCLTDEMLLYLSARVSVLRFLFELALSHICVHMFLVDWCCTVHSFSKVYCVFVHIERGNNSFCVFAHGFSVFSWLKSGLHTSFKACILNLSQQEKHRCN